MELGQSPPVLLLCLFDVLVVVAVETGETMGRLPIKLQHWGEPVEVVV